MSSYLLAKKYSFIVLILLAILAVPLIMHSRNSTPFPSKESPVKEGKATLSIKPATITTTKDSTGSFEVSLDPHTESVSSVELLLIYDPAVIQITEVTAGSFFTGHTEKVGAPVEIIKNIATAGKVHYAIGFPLGSNFSSSTKGSVARIGYKAVAKSTASPITLAISGTPQTMIADINAQNVLKSVSIAKIIVE